MAVVVVVLLPLLLLLPLAHLSVPCKKRRERKIEKDGQKGKNGGQGPSKKMKEGFQFHFNKKEALLLIQLQFH
jgi:hypothetical protein